MRRSPSASVISSRWRRSEVSTAPMGYPDASPMAVTKPPTPGRLNSGRIRGSSSTPTKATTPRPISSWPPTKKGSSAGKTTSHHSSSPRTAERKAASGYATMAMTRAVARTGKVNPDRRRADSRSMPSQWTGDVAAQGSSVGCRRAAPVDGYGHAGGVRPRVTPLPSTLAADPVLVPVKPVRIGRQHTEPPVGDVPAVQVRRGRGDAHVRIGGVAVLVRRWLRALIPALAGGRWGGRGSLFRLGDQAPQAPPRFPRFPLEPDEKVGVLHVGRVRRHLRVT